MGCEREQFPNGVETHMVNSDHFNVSATVHLSTTLYGWLCGLAGKVKLISPQAAVDELHQLVQLVVLKTKTNKDNRKNLKRMCERADLGNYILRRSSYRRC